MAEDIINNLDERIKDLESNLLMMNIGAIKKKNTGNNNMYNVSFDDKYSDWDSEVQDIKNKIIELKLKKKNLLKNKHNEIDNKFIIINEDKQHITIGARTYPSFEVLFKNKKLGYKKSQLKGGMRLIYAIGTKGLEGKLLISSILPLCADFKNNRNNWGFEKKGISKAKITKNDCDSANSILDACGLSIKLKLSDNKEEIIIE